MAQNKNELIEWLQEAPGDTVAIDEGGLTLLCYDGDTCDNPEHEAPDAFEIGGVPLPEGD